MVTLHSLSTDLEKEEEFGPLNCQKVKQLLATLFSSGI